MISTIVTTLIGTILVALAGELRATPLTYDSFSYPLDETLNGQSGGTGFAAPWIEAGVTGDYDRVQAGSLNFGALQTAGKSIQSRAPANFFTDLSRDITDIPGTPGTTIWTSFLVRKDTTGGTPPEDYFGLVLYPATGEGLFIGDPFENDFYSLGVAGASAGLVASNKTVTPSNTAFLVAQISFLAGADQISLYVDPAPGDIAPATADAVKSDFDLTGLDVIGFVAGSSTANPRWGFDELRFGTTYGDVAPVPEPTSITLLASGLVLLYSRRRPT